MIQTQRALCLSALVWAIGLRNGHALEPWAFESAGLRTGFSATRLDEPFGQLLAFTRVGTPSWDARISQKWYVKTTMDISAGTLGNERDLAFMGSVGPVFTLRRDRFPIELTAGISPTILSQYQFGEVNLGIPFQFTNHGGFNFRLSRHWIADYRYQHMSNASLTRHNTGLDLHSISLAYHF